MYPIAQLQELSKIWPEPGIHQNIYWLRSLLLHHGKYLPRSTKKSRHDRTGQIYAPHHTPALVSPIAMRLDSRPLCRAQ